LGWYRQYSPKFDSWYVFLAAHTFSVNATAVLTENRE
jgi:hypothetical protein